MYPSQFRYYWAWKRNLIIFDCICYVKQPQSESLDTYFKKTHKYVQNIFNFNRCIYKYGYLRFTHIAALCCGYHSCHEFIIQVFMSLVNISMIFTDGVATFNSSIDFYPICSIFHIYCLWICFIQLNVLYILYVHVLQISIYKHFLILCDVKNLYDGIVATWRIFEYKLISIILYVVIDVAWERTVVRVYITVACSRTISWLPQHTLAIIIWIYLISVVLFNVIVMLIWKYVE